MSIDGRLADLAARFELEEEVADQLRTLLDVVATDPHAPTAARDRSHALDVHLADSLSALQLAEARSATRIADLGSGAGFPGLPLAIALPAADVSLVEGSARKCNFLARAITGAAVRNARVVPTRAEAWAAGIGVHDLVTARALASLDVVCEYAAPLLMIGGALVAWKGILSKTESARAAAAAAELGLDSRKSVRSHPYAGSRDHHLYVYLKVRPTPARYPRRPGMARKHPLGSSR